jgi:hypothetical protein
MCRWLALLVQCAKQQAHVAGSPASLQLQDSCCAVLAGMSHAPSTTAALLASRQLRQEVVQLLHGVLHRWAGQRLDRVAVHALPQVCPLEWDPTAVMMQYGVWS